jgi:ribosome-binding factor A
MPKEYGRNRRVGQFIKEELSVLIQRDFPLNENGMITLTNVDLSSDLKNATIYITALNNKQSNEELVAAINERASHFRHELSQMLTMRGVPLLNFKYDESIERAQRLSDIIDSVSVDKNDSNPDG